MMQLVKNLQIALGERIDAQEWMTPATKKVAREKLDAFYVKIGYPDKWKDYSGLTIDAGKSLYDNVLAYSKFRHKQYLDEKMGKPVDRDEWYMTPQTVNAYYNPTTNEICFPAGILQYPRFRYQATKAVQVQQRIRQLEKIVPIEIDEVDTSALRLKFPPCLRSGDYPVICDQVAKSYGEHQVFANVDMMIKRGEKVAFVGKNGEGKSTLVKCIMGEIDYEGTLKVGHNTQIGYFAQNQAQLLDENLTVFETIDNVAKGEIRLKIKDILGAFMFGGEASDKYVKVLSGGERSRLAMIRLLLEPVNFLILDEPTNHLDMQSKDVLKEAIRAFDGTAIIVSHDRDFLDGLVDKVYEFGGGKVREHLGGIYEYLRFHNARTSWLLRTKEHGDKRCLTR